MADYVARCRRTAGSMLADNWPRLHSPVESGEYATAYRSELIWRLVWPKGSQCPDMTGTAYEASWYALRKFNNLSA